MSYRKPHDEERPLPDPKLDLDALHVRADGRYRLPAILALASLAWGLVIAAAALVWRVLR